MISKTLVSRGTLKFLTTVVITLVATNSSVINSMDYIQNNATKQSNNSSMNKLLNNIFKNDLYFDEYKPIEKCSNSQQEIYYLDKDKLEEYEKNNKEYWDNFCDKHCTNELLKDIASVFNNMYYTMNFGYHIHDMLKYAEEHWHANTYVNVTELLKYKELFDKYTNGTNSTEFINAMDEHLSNNKNINSKYISFEHLLYYVRNKILQLGKITVQNLNNIKDEKDRKDKVLDTFEIIKQIADLIQTSMYSGNDFIQYQTNTNEIKEKFEKGIMWHYSYALDYWKIDTINIKNNDLIKFVVYPKLLQSQINKSVCKFYKTYYHELISSKVDKLHNNIMKKLNKVSNNISNNPVNNKTIKCNSYIGLEYDILRENNNIHPGKYKEFDIRNQFKDGTEMSLQEYLQKTIQQLNLIKKYYDSHIRLLYGEEEQSQEMTNYHAEQSKLLEQQEKEGKLTIICAASNETNLADECNKYTECYIYVAKKLISNIVEDNKTENEDLKNCLKLMENSKKTLCIS